MTEQERNAAVARRFREEVLAKDNMQVFDEVVSDNIVVNSSIRPFAAMVGKPEFCEGLGTLAALAMAQSFSLADPRGRVIPSRKSRNGVGRAEKY